MKIYPAVDIKDGKCVRLRKGAAEDKTVYFENPVDAAKAFLDAGSKCIHVVDLDGAFEGEMVNLKTISAIAELGMFVELGGGMRDEVAVKAAFNAGVSRAIIGTKACTNPEFAIDLASKYGEKIAVGIDAKGGMVAIKGWVEVSQTSAHELAKKLAEGGVKTFIYTDIDTDGMLSGVNVVAQKQMLETLSPFGANLIASGGVASITDIEKMLLLDSQHSNLDGVIVGKAIYEKKINLKEAITLVNG
ncbi:MAG: 1-(5-phosphoribosyl)-5-[(5-phosphoribosylamino)methylideneamino]imidazole-4-carboxamide isomerase [Verrucomicrobiaceae bacterium]|nr:1-(5-phosphoribosyl)-5-[(5-phosphoribosylamino)methylideneamino]imidazole-4-carboxamide isomerase [Verrucomicrobiaceae bacterium]